LYTVICDKKEELEEATLGQIRIKPDRVVFKQYKDETYLSSFIIPTVKYPVNDEAIRVFSDLNTEELTDSSLLALFDGVFAEIGHCYTNSENLYNSLIKNGVSKEDVYMYVGWLLIQGETPTHHMWVVYKEKYLLDLTNRYYAQTKYLMSRYSPSDNPSLQELRECLVDFYKTKRKNSELCTPVGKAQAYVYAGCKIESAEAGKKIYNDLVKKFPYHEILNGINEDGTTKVQKMILEK
jgi:hypothetical protein